MGCARTSIGPAVVVCLLAACETGGLGSGSGRPEEPDRPDAGGPRPRPSPSPPGDGDRCGDGVDDDDDSRIDEGCACSDGDRQPCWPGPAARREVGACRDGVQRCEPFGEFLAWGRCEGAVLPAAEVEDNGVDEDCDGVDPGGACIPRELGEACGGGRDDDCDGLADCDDPDCAGEDGCRADCPPYEAGEQCRDGIDNDCDGDRDCLDRDCVTDCSTGDDEPDCRHEFPFIFEIACGDGRDNDCDGSADCFDRDCIAPGRCGCEPSELACGDGVDQDCDGAYDCDDLDCQRCSPGSYRFCDEPTYCSWGRQQCQPDGRFGPCIETFDRPAGCDSSLYSTACCVAAGECCQDFPAGDGSVGSCAGIVDCW